MVGNDKKRKATRASTRSGKLRKPIQRGRQQKESCPPQFSSANKEKSCTSQQNNNRITVSKEPSTQDGDLSKSDESSDSDISSVDDPIGLDDQLKKKPPPKRTLPSTVVAETIAVSDITKARYVNVRPETINPQTQNYAISKVSEKRVKSDLRAYLRKFWYKGIKFIDCDETAREFIQDAIIKESVVIPTGWTHDFFCELYQSKVYTAMSNIRHNSQNLARGNYLGKNSIKK